MHCQLCWIVASMVFLDSKTSYLIQRRHIACSLASVRVTSSVCQPVQGSRLDVIVPWHAYCDISSITTYRVAAALRRRYTIRFARTKPADGSTVTCDMSLECPGHLKIGWKGFTARSIFEPILPPELVRLPNQSAADTWNDLHLIRLRTRDGWRVTMHLNAPILLRNIFVSVNMELFCRINNKPRNALPVMLDCSQYGISRFKNLVSYTA